MALYTKTGDEDIPRDAVKLSEDDAIKFMRNIVGSWKNPSDVFFIKYGAGILSGLTALTSIYIHNYYRYRMRLQSFGRYSTYLPVVVVPSFGSFLTHTRRVQEPLLINKFTCPVCMEIRATAFQVTTGVCYPLMLAPTAALMMATRYHTYNVPYITKDPKGVWKLFVKFTKPMSGTFTAIAGLHVIIAAFIVYQEAKSVDTVNQKLMEFEEDTLQLN